MRQIIIALVVILWGQVCFAEEEKTGTTTGTFTVIVDSITDIVGHSPYCPVGEFALVPLTYEMYSRVVLLSDELKQILQKMDKTERFYDIHCHAMNLNHPNLLAFSLVGPLLSCFARYKMKKTLKLKQILQKMDKEMQKIEDRIEQIDILKQRYGRIIIEMQKQEEMCIRGECEHWKRWREQEEDLKQLKEIK